MPVTEPLTAPAPRWGDGLLSKSARPRRRAGTCRSRFDGVHCPNMATSRWSSPTPMSRTRSWPPAGPRRWCWVSGTGRYSSAPMWPRSSNTPSIRVRAAVPRGRRGICARHHLATRCGSNRAGIRGLAARLGTQSIGVYPVDYPATTDFPTAVDGVYDASAHVRTSLW
jgi:hypothetical protein